MKRLWITGYRSYELGVFKDDDPKVKVLKSVLRERISQAVINGFDWLITGGQLGVEQWSVAVANHLKKVYPKQYRIAVMLPFTHFGQQWNAKNQQRLAKAVQLADFSQPVSHRNYQSPRQLFNYQDFMLTHTDAALLVYDPDYPGKTKYDYNQIKRYAKYHRYPLTLVTTDDLQDAANDYEIRYEETHRKRFE